MVGYDEPRKELDVTRETSLESNEGTEYSGDWTMQPKGMPWKVQIIAGRKQKCFYRCHDNT